MSKLAAGDVLAVDAVNAFQNRALTINKDLNCIVHVRLTEKFRQKQLQNFPESAECILSKST